jgi:hypothetical protein
MASGRRGVNLHALHTPPWKIPTKKSKAQDGMKMGNYYWPNTKTYFSDYLACSWDSNPIREM